MSIHLLLTRKPQYLLLVVGREKDGFIFDSKTDGRLYTYNLNGSV